MQAAYDIAFIDRRRKVWLECTGEPFDFRAVAVHEVRSPDGDVELVRFACPRCGRLHESLRYY
jgi:hypothetical protein